MLLTEYDEKKHMRTLYREGYEDGEKAGFDKGEQAGFSRGEQAGFSRGEQTGFSRGEQAGFSKGEQAGFSRGEQAGFSKGEQDLLERQVLKKLQRGKDAATIADELEADVNLIREIMDQLSSPA